MTNANKGKIITPIIKLFGKCEISLTNNTINHIKGQNALLLAFVLMRGGRCKKETLLNSFYPDSDDAKRNLRVALHRLKATLPEGTMDSSRHEVWIAPKAMKRVDAYQFEQGLQKADQDWLRFGREGCDFVRVEETLRLYRDEFLVDVRVPDNLAIDKWLMMERITLHQNYVVWGERLAQQYMLDEAWTSAEHLLNRVLRLEPLHDGLCRMKVMSLAGQGQYKEARTEAKEYTKRLKVELGVTPSPPLRQAIEQVKQKKLGSQSVLLPNSSMPVYQTEVNVGRVFGRHRQKRQLITTLLERGTRLLALIGLGGVGKSVLAREISNSLQLLFRSGACFISLQALPDCLARETAEEQLVIALCNGLNVDVDQDGEIRERLFSALQTQTMIIVLDNLDRVMAGYELLAQLLHHAPYLKIVTTSRSVLPTHLFDGHTMRHVSGLEQEASMNYFIHCVQNRMDVDWFDDDKELIAQICRLVGGTPLAIQLATNWLPTFSLAQIVEQLQEDITFLDAADSIASSAQITSVIEQTWMQLPREEREVVAKLSMFANTFNVVSAAHITACTREMCRDLIQRGILIPQAYGLYQMHPLIQLFAAEKLDDNDVWRTSVHKAYCDYYYGLMKQYGNDQGNRTLVAQIKTETDDLQKALRLLLVLPHYSDKQQQNLIFRNVSYFHQIGRSYEINVTLNQLIKEQPSSDIVQTSLHLAF